MMDIHSTRMNSTNVINFGKKIEYTFLLPDFQLNSENIAKELQKYQPILPYFFSRQSSEFLPSGQNTRNMMIVGDLNFGKVQNF